MSSGGKGANSGKRKAGKRRESGERKVKRSEKREARTAAMKGSR